MLELCCTFHWSFYDDVNLESLIFTESPYLLYDECHVLKIVKFSQCSNLF